MILQNDEIVKYIYTNLIESLTQAVGLSIEILLPGLALIFLIYISVVKVEILEPIKIELNSIIDF